MPKKNHFDVLIKNLLCSGKVLCGSSFIFKSDHPENSLLTFDPQVIPT